MLVRLSAPTERSLVHYFPADSSTSFCLRHTVGHSAAFVHAATALETGMFGDGRQCRKCRAACRRKLAKMKAGAP